MGFDEQWAHRDCPWCGLQFGAMSVGMRNLRVDRAGKQPKWWAVLGCPSCGNVIALNVTGVGHQDHLLGVFPTEDQLGDHVAHLPEDVAGYYSDAGRVLRAGVPGAAAVQLRRTLEAAAAHFDVKAFPLVKAVEELVAKGLITEEFRRVLDHIRGLGNLGAHATDEQIDEVQASRAFRFTTQVLRNLFEIPAELRALTEGDATPT